MPGFASRPRHAVPSTPERLNRRRPGTVELTQIHFAAADGSDSSNAAQESINVVGAPTVSGSGNSAFYQLGGAAVAVDSGLTIAATGTTDLTGKQCAPCNAS